MSNTQNNHTENKNSVIAEEVTTQPEEVWPEIAVSILLEIVAVNYYNLLNACDDVMKQLIWKHSATFFKKNTMKFGGSKIPSDFYETITATSLQKKWNTMLNNFIETQNLVKDQGVTHDIKDVGIYEFIAKITRYDPNIQPQDMCIDNEECDIDTYIQEKGHDWMESLESDGPRFTYLNKYDINDSVYQKALCEKFTGMQSGDPVIRDPNSPNSDTQEYDENPWLNDDFVKVIRKASAKIDTEKPLLDCDSMVAYREGMNKNLDNLRKLNEEFIDDLLDVQNENLKRKFQDVEGLLECLYRDQTLILDGLYARRREDLNERLQIIEEANRKRWETERLERMEEAKLIRDENSRRSREDTDYMIERLTAFTKSQGIYRDPSSSTSNSNDDVTNNDQK